MSETPKPDIDAAIGRLKGFQRNAVDYAFHRLYEAPDSTRRFLIADEVGLGKTLIARGIIARAVDHLWETVDRIDVVYICSNAAIARQNLRRLNIGSEDDLIGADRITMLPTTLHTLEGNKLNFISCTPGTSFNLNSNMGQARERRLLYWLVRPVWRVDGKGPANVFQGNIASARKWRKRLKEFKEKHTISPELARRFQEKLRAQPDLKRTYRNLCKRFRRVRRRIPKEDRLLRARFIGELRSILARTCIDALEPDLVILDEFQRFKHLLTDDNEAGILAKQLFTYSDESADVRVLLLSATPYKMYTLRHEEDEDDHYQDFLRTVEFLDPREATEKRLQSNLDAYRRELYRLGNGPSERLATLKDEIQSRLRRVMSRTERTGGDHGSGDAMVVERPMTALALRPQDVRAYLQAEAIAREIDQPDLLEYWKSSPFLFNLMDDYQLKKRFTETLEVDGTSLARHLTEARDALLDFDRIEGYEELAPSNARLRALLADTVERGAWRLLWLPPTLPYWRLEPPFAGLEGFTKRLIFSGWKVVPKAIASLVSYEAERAIFRAAEEEPRNDSEARKRRQSPLLQFTYSDERYTGMPVLGLLYPSLTLSRIVDLPGTPSSTNGLPTLAEVLAATTERLSAELPKLRKVRGMGQPDERWYWAAPILLDLHHHERPTRRWLERDDLPSRWSGEEPTKGRGSDTADGGDRWAEHVNEARKLLTGDHALGPMPDDLAPVLARLALGGPAVTALRALQRIAPAGIRLPSFAHRDAAAQIAWGFRSLFNRPEAIAIVRKGDREQVYWRLVLDYACAACLPAVLDEYLHLERDLLGLYDHSPDKVVSKLAESIVETLRLRTSVAELDNIRTTGSRPRLERRRLRTHFALPFGRAKGEDESTELREDLARNAFNSPFWPFILASTSIGQEGLDFHPYCHAIVHWNLPSNPVDLEQREGRIHRFKGHAIRKNIVQQFGAETLANQPKDPWADLFHRAQQSVDGNDRHGLVPFWLYAIENGATIERYIPAMPLSKDRLRAQALRRSLAAYRMVFGQPRQDDLLEYLLTRVDQRIIEQTRADLQIDLSPRARSKARPEARATTTL